AVEFAVVLMPPASGQNDAVREALEKAGNGLCASAGIIEKIEAKFQESLARFRFLPGVLQQGPNVR
ncbi:MAG TPA: hypothetical protein VFE56_01085, partial [Candidatus Binataceae bacterium]|nr:hypothetical protein [Candidatus Binataceae bacterium]